MVWRFEKNPIIGRYATAVSNSVYNSVVVPFNGGFAGVFRIDDMCKNMKIYRGMSNDAINWKIDDAPIKFLHFITVIDTENPKSIKDFIMPSDIVGFEDGDFAVYSHFEKELRKLSANEKFDINLLQIKSELFTVMKIENGFAPIGLVDKYNSGGAILDMSCEEDGKVTLILKDGGKFVAYCENTPNCVKVNGTIVDFVCKDNLLLVESAAKGKTMIEIVNNGM